MIIDEAVEILSTTYGPLETVASGLPVDAYEAALALQLADHASVEYVCLKALVKAHPIPDIPPVEEPAPAEEPTE